MESTTTKAEFIIFKKGVTAHPVTILSGAGLPFDREFKVNKYKSLGYTVKSLKGDLI